MAEIRVGKVCKVEGINRKYETNVEFSRFEKL